VLKALGDTGTQLRQELGESLASIHKLSVPLEEATTSSLEALKSFSLGSEIRRKKDDESAVPYLEHAVQLDPHFARAYEELGIAYENLGKPNLSDHYFTKAFEMKEHVGPFDRFVIEANYYNDVTGDYPRAIQTYREWIDNYPNAFAARNNLGNLFAQIGQWEQSELEASTSFRLMPDNSHSAINSMAAYMALDRPKNADAVFEAAKANGVDNASIRAERYLLAFFQNDEAAMQQQLALADDKPLKWLLLLRQSDTEAYHGHLTPARMLTQEGVPSASSKGISVPYYIGWSALREAEVGNAAIARQAVERLLHALTESDLELSWWNLLIAGTANARSGGLPEYFRTRLSRAMRIFPASTMLHSYALPTMEAAIEINGGNPRQAIEALRVVAPYDLGSIWSLYPIYLRGLAHLDLHQGQQAAQEFQKILDHRGIVLNQVWGALAHLQLGRAQVMMGDKVAARKSYNDFLTLWKDADPDIPIYKQAKNEYAKLR
jgi:tetratricopeptide (TPR) repeat protein